MVTQKEVAERAGVSFITVSRVINQQGNVKEETRLRVEAAIAELNYHPNRQAQALNNGLLHTLALVTPRMYDLTLFNNFYIMQLLSGVELMGRSRGWDILLTTDYDYEGDFDFLRVWHQRKVDGLIFIGLTRFSERQMAEIEQRRIPCVSISDRNRSPAISWLDTDNHSAALDAVRRLLARGHRRFGFIGVEPEKEYNPNFIDREAAVRTAIERGRAEGLPLSLDILPSDSARPQNGVRIAQRFVEMKRRPTAVIAANDSLAFEFLHETSRHGVECPRDYSLIGFDAEPAGRTSPLTLASYSQPLVEMGRCAVEMLLAQLPSSQDAKKVQVFPLEFVDGATLGMAPPEPNPA